MPVRSAFAAPLRQRSRFFIEAAPGVPGGFTVCHRARRTSGQCPHAASRGPGLSNSSPLASSRRTTLSECDQLVPAEHRLKGDCNAYEEI